MSLTALVVNFNAGDLPGECVQSLLDNGAGDILIVDNASSDGSFNVLQQRFQGLDAVRFQSNEHNIGFGPAINRVLPGVDSEYFLIINPDCILEPNALTTLQGAMNDHPEAALAGPRVLNASGDREPAACRRFPTPRRSLATLSGLWRLEKKLPGLEGVNIADEDSPGSAAVIEATSGACMLFRTDSLREIGGFDEAYQLHCEDLDVMFRLGEAGQNVIYVPTAIAHHIQGVSSASRPFWVHREKHRGMARFFDVHLASAHSWLAGSLVRMGVWLHWLVLWPRVAIRAWRRPLTGNSDTIAAREGRKGSGQG